MAGRGEVWGVAGWVGACTGVNGRGHVKAPHSLGGGGLHDAGRAGSPSILNIYPVIHTTGGEVAWWWGWAGGGDSIQL